MIREGKVLYPDLSYELVGIAFNIFNEMGFGYQEKYYQRAYEQVLLQKNKQFGREKKCVIVFQGRKIGRYFIDFVVDNLIVIELKIANDFYVQHIKQVLGYLKATGLRLGILILFTKNGIRYKRIIN